MSKRQRQRHRRRRWLLIFLLVFVHCQVAVQANADLPVAAVGTLDGGDCHDPVGDPDRGAGNPCPLSETVTSSVVPAVNPPSASIGWFAAADPRRQLRVSDPGRILRRPPRLAELCRLLI